MADSAGDEARIAALADEAARQVGVEVLRIRLRRAGGARASLVVTIDRAEGVDLDAVADMSHALERLLDREDPIAGPYVLEVESPGERRPLRLPADAARFAGSRIELSLAAQGGEGRRRLRATLVGADEANVHVVPAARAAGAPADVLDVPLAQVEEARLDPEPAAAPVRARGGGKGRRT
jgi:ribosome maturation factor RimP